MCVTSEEPLKIKGEKIKGEKIKGEDRNKNTGRILEINWGYKNERKNEKKKRKKKQGDGKNRANVRYKYEK